MTHLREGDYIQRMADYVEKNLKRRYTLDQLESALIQQGHSRTAVRRAIALASERIPKNTMPLEPMPQTTVIEEEKKAEPKHKLAGLAYILGMISGIIVFLNARKDDKYTRFHSLQSIFFTILTGVLFAIIYIILSLINSAGGSAWGKWAPTVYLVYWIAFEVIMLLKIPGALKGVKKKLPVIGHLSENLA
jgi:uncharacterized membrane protein